MLQTIQIFRSDICVILHAGCHFLRCQCTLTKGSPLTFWLSAIMSMSFRSASLLPAFKVTYNSWEVSWLQEIHAEGMDARQEMSPWKRVCKGQKWILPLLGPLKVCAYCKGGGCEGRYPVRGRHCFDCAISSQFHSTASRHQSYAKSAKKAEMNVSEAFSTLYEDISCYAIQFCAFQFWLGLSTKGDKPWKWARKVTSHENDSSLKQTRWVESSFCLGVSSM